MARTVLGFPHRWAAPLVLAIALHGFPALAAGPAPCSSKVADRTIRDLQRQVTAGTFYKELLVEFGKPLTCTVDSDDGGTSLTYSFGDNGRLIARIDPSAELSEQRVELDREFMDSAKAISLLKTAELDAYPPHGCGIVWTNGEEESPASMGTRQVVYRGNACNCQARLTYKGKGVIALVLRSAC
jgi:hypothetical protein